MGCSYLPILIEDERDKICLERKKEISKYLVILTLEIPDDVSTEYSEPVMITGASLRLSEESVDKECGGLTYQATVPSMKSIFTSAKSNNICGDTTVNICMRMSLNSVEKDNKSFIYKKLPEIKITLPCSGDSFIGAGFEAKTISDDASTIGLEIEAKRVVSLMKLFNANSCDEESEW